jgi:MFS transporter, PPP family, 3-phenylpropionic acid transporter
MTHSTVRSTNQHSPQWQGGAFYLTFFGAMGIYLPFLNVYFRQLGLSGWQIGLLSALAPAATLLASAPLSLLADRRSWHVRMLAAGTGGLVLSLVVLTFPTAFWGLFAAMLFYAVCFSPLTPLADSLAAGMASRRNLNFGDMRLWGSLGFAGLSIAAGALWQHSGYRPMFVAGGALYVVAIWYALHLEDHVIPALREYVSFRVIGNDAFVLTILVTTFLAMAAYGMDSTFSGIYMTHLGGAGLYVGLLFGLSAMFELPAMRYTGHIIRRLGGARTLMLAYGLYTITYTGFALARSPNVLLLLCSFRGLAFGLFYAGTVRLINDRTPPNWAATIQGIMNAAGFGLARLLSGPIGGRIFDASGPAAVYVAAAAAAAAGLVVMAGAWILRIDQLPGTIPVAEDTRSRRRA